MRVYRFVNNQSKWVPRFGLFVFTRLSLIFFLYTVRRRDGRVSHLKKTNLKDKSPLKKPKQLINNNETPEIPDKRKSSPESDNCVPKTNKTSPDSKTSGKRKKYSVSTSGASLSDSESDVNEKAKSAKEPVKKKRKQTVQKDNSSNTDEKENKTRKVSFIYFLYQFSSQIISFSSSNIFN